ncbi:MAG: hypothetical protein ABL977_09865 [Candidatus Eisenbacteria bacterium]
MFHSRSLARAAFAVPVLLALAAPALADVTIQEKTVSSGLGGFGNGTTTTTRVIATDKGREDEQFTYTGRLKTFAGKPRSSSTITRLDRELIWELEHAKKQYGEMTFAEMREAMAKAAADAKAEMAKAEPAKAHDDVQMDYKVDVKRTGKHEKVNGFDAEQWVITLTGTPKDKSNTEQAGGILMKLDGWYSTAVPGQAEQAAYYKRWAEKMGLEPQVRTMASALMAQHGDAVRQIALKMKDLKGVAVRSTLTMEMDDGLTPAQRAELEKSRVEESKSRAENAKKQDAKDDVDAKLDAGGSLAKGNVSGALGGFLSRKLNKAAEKKVEKSLTPEPGAASGPMFTVTTDVLSVTTGSATASFEIPAGYKKTERRK